jgi:hypothetical protein
MLIVSKKQSHEVVNVELRPPLSRKQSSNRPPSKEARKRNKAVTLFLLPLIVFLWIVGSDLYWLTPRKAQTKRSRTAETGTLILRLHLKRTSLIIKQAIMERANSRDTHVPDDAD